MSESGWTGAVGYRLWPLILCLPTQWFMGVIYYWGLVGIKLITCTELIIFMVAFEIRWKHSKHCVCWVMQGLMLLCFDCVTLPSSRLEVYSTKSKHIVDTVYTVDCKRKLLVVFFQPRAKCFVYQMNKRWWVWWYQNVHDHVFVFLQVNLVMCCYPILIECCCLQVSTLLWRQDDSYW